MAIVAPVGGEGILGYQMDTHLRTAMRSDGSELQFLGTVSPEKYRLR